MACGACRAFGVATMAASREASPARATQSVVTCGMSYFSANTRADSSRWFATATNSSPWARIPRAWKSWIHPQPNNATFMRNRLTTL